MNLTSVMEDRMRPIRILLAALVLGAGLATSAAAAPDEGDDWRMFGRVLTLMQQFARIAAESPDPQAVEKGIDAMLSGHNAEANRLAGALLDEMFQDAPPEYRGALASIARDLASVARRDRARAASRAEAVVAERAAAANPADKALQARKDLHAMGLRYHDPAQFLDAIKRDDALAVELFVLARGVNLSARDADGRSAAELAQRSGNPQIAALLGGAGAR
jgi:hypothetical protein